MDLDAVRKRLSVLQSSQKRNTNLFKPEPGKNTVRIVPYQFNQENPFIELYFHYDIGKKSYLSNYTFGDPDPVCEFSDKLKSTGEKDDWVLGKKLEPTLRTYVPVIVRGKEKEGVKFWGFGKEIYQELLQIIADPDYGDITDLSHGRDIVIEYKTPKEMNNKYGKVTVRVRPNQNRATDDKDVAKMILNDQPNIEDVYQKQTYEELKQALNKWLNPEEEEEVSDEMITKARQRDSDTVEPKSDLPFDQDDDSVTESKTETGTTAGTTDDFDSLFGEMEDKK